MKCSSFTKCLQDGCHDSWLLTWESDVLMLVKNFGPLNEKVMASLQESLLGTKPGFTSTNRKRRERARNGAIPHHQNQRSMEQTHQQGRLCWLFWDEKGIILEHYTPRGTTVTSASYSDLLKNHLRPAIKSKWRGLLSSGVLLQHDSARPHTAHTTVATITDRTINNI